MHKQAKFSGSVISNTFSLFSSGTRWMADVRKLALEKVIKSEYFFLTFCLVYMFCFSEQSHISYNASQHLFLGLTLLFHHLFTNSIRKATMLPVLNFANVSHCSELTHPDLINVITECFMIKHPLYTRLMHYKVYCFIVLLAKKTPTPKPTTPLNIMCTILHYSFLFWK